MRRRTQRGGWRTWVLGAVGATVAGAVLARRSGSLKQLRERGAARLRDAVASAAAAAGAMSVTSGAAARGAVAAPPSPVQGPPAADVRWVASRLGTTYYRSDCRSALRLTESNRLTFATEAAARAAGYRRSAADGC